MANVRLPSASRNAACDGIVDLIDGGPAAGTIKIYDGTQPATGGGGLSGNTLLATLTFSVTAFGAAAAGVATAAAITDDTSADATGTATWARLADSAGTTIFDCDVGTSGATLNLNTTSIVAGGVVSCSAFTVTMPAS